MDENEIQIVLTAVDNASATIDKVNNSLGGIDGASGFTASADVASKSADDLAGSFKGMTVEQLSYISTLGMSKEKQDAYNKALEEATKKTKAARDAINSGAISIGGMTVSAGVAATVFGTLAVAILGAATAYGAFKIASDFSTDALKDGSGATEEQIKTATEFKKLMNDVNREIDVTKQNWERFWFFAGSIAAATINGIVEDIKEIPPALGIAIDLSTNINKSSRASDNLAKEINAVIKSASTKIDATIFNDPDIWSNIFTVSQNVYTVQKELATEQEKLNRLVADGPVPGQSWSDYQKEIEDTKGKISELEQSILNMTNNMITGMMLSQIMKDGIFSEGEQAIFEEWLIGIGADSVEAINLIIDTTNTGLGKMAELAKESGNSIKTAKGDVNDLQAAVDNIKDKTITITIIEKKEGEGGGWRKEGGGGDSKAFGGIVRPGQRALVGDKPGGIPTPWSEIIEALPGGGVKVYPNSQTSAMRNMPSFAEGGTFGSDLTGDLSRTLRDLPNAIAMAIESTMQRSYR